MTSLTTRAGLLVFLLVLLGSGTRLRAITINLTFDSSVTALPNAAAYETATRAAAQQLDSLLTDNVTVNITVFAVAGTGTFGESTTQLVGSSYTEIRNSIIAQATSTNQKTAIAHDLPTQDPTSGGSFFVSTALAKALGIIGASSNEDGEFYFGTGYNFSLDPSHRAVNGEYDFIGVAEHEMTEAMGRTFGLGTDFGNGLTNYIPYDLFRYSGNGVRSLIQGSGNYFSIDGGATNLKAYNFPNGDGSDPQDWATGTNDSCNNQIVQGTESDFTTVDVTTMNVMGFAAIFGNGPAPTTATKGTAYSFTYTGSSAADATAPTFALASGSLPPGLSLTSGGLLSGTPTTAGTYTGTISGAISVGNLSGGASTDTVAQPFSITVAQGGQTGQTISFGALANRTLTQSPFTVSATASSGGAVTFAVTSGPATVSGNTVTLNGTGSISITASQAGNSTFAAAPNVTQTFTVAGGTDFSDWAAGFGIASDLTDILENDNQPNLLKYLYDIDPSHPITAAERSALPTVTIVNNSGTNVLALTYRQYALQMGVTINVQTSSDLVHWQTVANPAFVEIGLDPQTSDPILQVQVPITTTPQYLRLNVTSP